MIDAVVLAGGRGTRLSSTVPDVPKPLALVGGKPFLTHIVEYLNASGKIGRIVISAGYKADLVQNWAKQAKGKITVVTEPEPLGTGGGMLHAMDKAAQTETVLALNGDSLIRLDLPAMIEAHKKSECAVTMAVTQVKDVSASGEVVLTGDKVGEFREKGGEKRPGWINAGIYLFNKESLATEPRGACSLEYDLMPELLKEGVHAFCAKGAFVDIGTPENYAAAAGILGVV